MRDTIKKHSDFGTRDDGAPVFKCALFMARDMPTKFPGDARYGIMAPKKTHKRAVDRNRAKRLMRVWLRANEELMSPERDYVFIVRTDILTGTLKEGTNCVKRAIKKLNSFADGTATWVPNPALVQVRGKKSKKKA